MDFAFTDYKDVEIYAIYYYFRDNPTFNNISAISIVKNEVSF
jgi:hypothetical protein